MRVVRVRAVCVQWLLLELHLVVAGIPLAYTTAAGRRRRTDASPSGAQGCLCEMGAGRSDPALIIRRFGEEVGRAQKKPFRAFLNEE